MLSEISSSQQCQTLEGYLESFFRCYLIIIFRLAFFIFSQLFVFLRESENFGEAQMR